MQVGNVECVEPDHIRFDFLGKDSMRYENEVAVDKKVFKLMQKFCKGAPAASQLCSELHGQRWAVPYTVRLSSARLAAADSRGLRPTRLHTCSNAAVAESRVLQVQARRTTMMSSMRWTPPRSTSMCRWAHLLDRSLCRACHGVHPVYAFAL